MCVCLCVCESTSAAVSVLKCEKFLKSIRYVASSFFSFLAIPTPSEFGTSRDMRVRLSVRDLLVCCCYTSRRIKCQRSSHRPQFYLVDVPSSTHTQSIKIELNLTRKTIIKSYHGTVLNTKWHCATIIDAKKFVLYFCLKEKQKHFWKTKICFKSESKWWL